MGTKVPIVPDDYGPGDNCLACYAAGKTPNYVFARFWDVVPCTGKPDPPNGMPFILSQIETSACEFEGTIQFEGNTWRAYYHMHAAYGDEYRAELSMNLRTPPSAAAFFGRVADCGTVFDTNLNLCPGPGGEGGRGIVTVYIDPIIIFLTSHAHLVILPKTLYERWDVAMDHSIYRLATLADHTNVMVYIDREIIESE